MQISTQIAENIAAVRDRIARAAHAAGRDPAEVTLVAVSKTHPAEAVLAALEAGAADFGENRVQEAEQKILALEAERARLRWHLIGHLQRNKARLAARLFDRIHSVDSLRLAEALDRYAAELRPEHPLSILLQVNVSGETSKEGFDLPGALANPALPAFVAEVERIAALPNLRLEGLMTIAPLVEDAERVRPVFRDLRLLRDALSERVPGLALSQLSMGMSDDLDVAIAEGATLVRVGRAIFGARY
jgi:PLP dependent protein